MKTFGARGASLIYSIVWHFFLCISMAIAEHILMVKISCKWASFGGEKIAQRQLSTFVLTAALRNKKRLNSSRELHNFRTNGNFIVALRSRAIYNLNNRFIAFPPPHFRTDSVANCSGFGTQSVHTIHLELH
jgi:hypothetical protein